MEYLYFVGSVTAVALVFLLVWNAEKLRSLIFSGGRHGDLFEDPIPPRRKTVGGLSAKETEQIEFQQRIEAWQKEYESRRERFNQAHASLKGQKYVYKPSRKRQSALKSPSDNVTPIRPEFELLN